MLIDLNVKSKCTVCTLGEVQRHVRYSNSLLAVVVTACRPEASIVSHLSFVSQFSILLC